eukprot:Clim_evm5s41 gene=Clim_evmTU5s41
MSQQESKGVIGDVVDSINTPGVNSGVIIVTNVAFAGLFGSLLLLGFGWEFNFHVIFMLVTTIVLWGAINYFIAEITNLPPAEEGNQNGKQVKAKPTRVTKGRSKRE